MIEPRFPNHPITLPDKPLVFDDRELATKPAPPLMMANRYLTPVERLKLNPPLPFHWHYPRVVPMNWVRVRTIWANTNQSK